MIAICYQTKIPISFWCRWRLNPDDAEKSSVSYTVYMCSRQNLRNKKEENPIKSTGVVLAKYPPKVKLKNFHHSKVSELG